MESINKQLRLSIIVPVYNVEPYIERCLLSLLDQDIPQSEYEIIVVNDGTPDNSAVVAQRIADENNNIILVHRENGGLSAARNTGMEHVHGRYVFFVDSDDYIESNVLSALLQSAESRKLELLAFTTCRREADNRITWVKNNNRFFQDADVLDGITLLRKGWNVTSVWSYLYSTEMLQRFSFRFKDGIVHEDIEYNYRVFTKLNRVGAIDLLTYNYCVNDGHSITRGRTLKQQANALMSNMIAAASIKSFIRDESVPKDIFNIFDSRMNSMLVAQFFSLLKQEGRLLPMEFLCDYISKSSELGVYPIKGYNSRRKTRLARCIINIKPLMMFLFHLSRK